MKGKGEEREKRRCAVEIFNYFRLCPALAHGMGDGAIPGYWQNATIIIISTFFMLVEKDNIVAYI